MLINYSEQLPKVVFYVQLSGKWFLDSVDKFDAAQDLPDELVPVQFSPFQRRPFGQLEHHGQHRCHAALASGLGRAEVNGLKC